MRNQAGNFGRERIIHNIRIDARNVVRDPKLISALNGDQAVRVLTDGVLQKSHGLLPMVYRLAWEPGAMLSSKVAKSRANDDQSRGSTGRRQGDDRESYVD